MAAIAVVPMLIILPIIVLPFARREYRKLTTFNDVKELLVTSDTRFEFGEAEWDGTSRKCWVYFTLHNNSDYRWDEFEFTVKYLDEDGKSIDLENESKDVTIQPKSELLVRLECNITAQAAEKVKSVVVEVTEAQPPFDL